jgi:Polysaccharide lyase
MAAIEMLKELIASYDEMSRLQGERDKLIHEHSAALAEAKVLRAKVLKLEERIRDLADHNAPGGPTPPVEPPAGPELPGPPQPPDGGGASVPARAVFVDPLTSIPLDVKEGGAYLIDAQPNAFKAGDGVEVRCYAKGPLDRNKTRRRCEFGLRDVRFPKNRIYRRDDYGKSFRYSLDIAFPAQPFKDSGKAVVFQFHGGHRDPHDKGSRNPVLSLEFLGEPRRLRWVQAAFESSQRKTLWESDDFDTSTWYTWVVEARWSDKSDGRLSVTVDGQQIIGITGQNAYEDKDRFIFCRAGIYVPNFTERAEDYKPDNYRSAAFKNLKIEELP